ncbi:MAG TPA: NADH dehydrogenase (quinone) subunit G [Acidimicrobiales bacterium]|nr:NADH dehydrogenase (quinone) subunit G [Acidimicrobiales bacterium]
MSDATRVYRSPPREGSPVSDPTEAPPDDGVKITIDGREFTAHKGELLIAAAERAGTYIPHFCYHSRMSPVGMCRMCLVEVDSGRGPGLQPSCMVPVSDGMVVDTESETTKRAQEGILELLLINHPLDCPVCDKGGECPLQDQAVAFGPGESRFVEEKRHYEKPIPISDLVNLDRERCILCDRCTRFAREVAGDPLISFTERGNRTQVLTFPDDPFSSYFSGNTVQICPVGALTAAPYRFRARPWDLDQVESTCTTCSVGCRIAVQSSGDQIVRRLGVDIDPVNHGWLCDRGRFDYESAYSPERITDPLMRGRAGDSELIEATWPAAMAATAETLREAIDAHGASSVAVLGGARLTNEDAYTWSKLARTVIGTDNIDSQLADGLAAEMVLTLPRATIDEACSADTVIMFGVDPKEELPVLHLRLRHAVVEDKVPMIEFSPVETSLSRHCRSVRHLPGALTESVSELLASEGERIGSGSVVVVVGRGSLAGSGEDIEAAVAAIRQAIPHATFLPALRRGNVMGALQMGLSPGILPGGLAFSEADRLGEDWAGSQPVVSDEPGLDAAGILAAAAAGRVAVLILLGADPLADVPDRDLAERALAGAGTVVAVDTHLTVSARRAHVVLPASGPGEKAGTTTNLEGRISRLGPKVTPPGTARPDWMIAVELADRLGVDMGFADSRRIWDEISTVVPMFSDCPVERIESPEAQDGILCRPAGDGDLRWDPPAAVAAPPVDAYALRLVSSRKLYDQATMTANSPSLAGLAEESRVRLNPRELDRLGVTDGGRLAFVSPRTRIIATVSGDEKVPRGVMAMTFNAAGPAASELIELGTVVTEVRVETL